MLTEFILMPFIWCGTFILDLLPNFSMTIPDGVLNGISILSQNVGYILPLEGLLTIFNVWLAFNGFRILFSIIIRAKSFIPLMGA